MKTNMETLYLLILVVTANVLFTSASFMLMRVLCCHSSYTNNSWLRCHQMAELGSLVITNNCHLWTRAHPLRNFSRPELSNGSIGASAPTMKSSSMQSASGSEDYP